MQSRAVALGQHLIEVHDWLRVRLDAIRAGDGSGPTDLRTHCLTFCSILEEHHSGEDRQLFPFLAEQHPELAPVIEELMRDHRQVAAILERVAELSRELDAQPDPAEVARVRIELDGLAALLENHLTYEERKLVPILDRL